MGGFTDRSGDPGIKFGQTIPGETPDVAGREGGATLTEPYSRYEQIVALVEPCDLRDPNSQPIDENWQPPEPNPLRRLARTISDARWRHQSIKSYSVPWRDAPREKLRGAGERLRDLSLAAGSSAVAAITRFDISEKAKSTREFYAAGESRKKRIAVTTAVGGLAVAGIVAGAYFASRAGGVAPPKRVGSHAAELFPIKHLDKLQPLQRVPDSLPAKPPVAHHGAEAGSHIASLGYSGDTIELEESKTLIRDHLKDSGHNLYEVARYILHQKHLSWEGARHLFVGYTFRMPSVHVMRELFKLKS